MNAFMKIVLLVIVALCVQGFAEQYYLSSDEYETVCIHEVVRPKDTFDNLASHWYNAENEKECFDEWLAIQRRRNRRLFVKADGSQRQLQISDIVCFEIRQRVVKGAK